MKHQQVVVDYWTMVKTSCTCLLLALSGYVLIKMIQTIFWLPGYLEKNQKHLEDLAAKYNIDVDQIKDEIENEKVQKSENASTSKIISYNQVTDEDEKKKIK